MTKRKSIILILTAFLLVVIPISTTEIPHEVSAKEAVLGTKATATLAVADTTTTAKKPTVAKKPVAKKKVVKKKSKRKERLITAPPMITVETAPHSGKR